MLHGFGVKYDARVGSAHKGSGHVDRIIEENDALENTSVIYIALAGRQNALGPKMAATTANPVITLPIYSDKFGGTDVTSALRTPSRIGTVVASSPEEAALFAVRTLALNNPELAEKVLVYQGETSKNMLKDDEEIRAEFAQMKFD